MTDFAPLTPRQQEIGLLAAQGLSSRAIGDRLGIAKATVDTHVQVAAGRLQGLKRSDLPARRRLVRFITARLRAEGGP